MKKAISALTRGYKSLEGYKTLIQRNKAIKKFINLNNNIPLVLFHEGNIIKDHQDFIIDQSLGQKIEFVDISKSWFGGYEGMCRFNILELWEYLKEYDAVLRVDEDSIISKCPIDPFSLIGNNVFLKTVYWGESHSETNATFPQFLESLTGAKKEDFYNNKFPYTNLCLVLPSFWNEPSMNLLLQKIGTSPLQKINRWGDLPVLGSLLNIYASGRVGTLTGLEYTHLSHGFFIKSE